MSVGVFYSAYLVAGRDRALVNPALVVGKAAFAAALVACLLGALGIAVDRKKLLAIAAMLLGWTSAGWIGMFVYNI
jgi:hypothetical protein